LENTSSHGCFQEKLGLVRKANVYNSDKQFSIKKGLIFTTRPFMIIRNFSNRIKERKLVVVLLCENFPFDTAVLFMTRFIGTAIGKRGTFFAI